MKHFLTVEDMNKIILYMKVTSTLAAISLLQGCVSAAMSGVSSGAQACYNHHNLQNAYHDQKNSMHVDRAIHWYTNRFKTSNVSVSTFNNILILVGQVPTAQLRVELDKLARANCDAKHIYNLTTVSPPASSLTRVSDSWITTKIKTQLIAENEIDPSQIKVITENGTVYLIGTVFPDQADIATYIARTTAGVQNVVRVFSYLEITKQLHNAGGTATG
jgi:osmotically-inducible protein OsmY